MHKIVACASNYNVENVPGYDDLDLVLQANLFQTQRGLTDYTEILGQQFMESCLDPSTSVLDVGAGQAHAWRDLFKKQPKKTGDIVCCGIVIPVEAEDLVSTLSRQYPFKYLMGDILNQPLQKNHFNVVVDMYGALSYSPSPDQVLRKYHACLANEGSIFMNKGNRFSVIVDNKKIMFTDWLMASIQDGRITGFSGTDSKRDCIILTKNEADFTIPVLTAVSINYPGKLRGLPYIILRQN